MIQIQDVRIQYGERILFKGVTFQINSSDHIALIGRNGAGKSTLFSVVEGDLTPDEGLVQYPKGLRIGHLEQTIVIDGALSIKEAAQEAFSDVKALEEEHEELQGQLESFHDYESPEYMDLLDRFNLNLERLNHYGVDEIEKQTELILKGLGFNPDQFEQKVNTLSGGWQMRVQLAKLLLQQPDLLLLDEPTNHLDIEAIIWLESFIKEYPSAVMVISHDREFLRNTSNRIIEIENSKIYDYNLGYDKYVQQKELVRSQQEAAYKNQQKEIAEKERTIKRFMAKATKTSMAQSMQKQLDKMERIELDAVEDKNMRIRFLPVPRSGRTVLKGQNITMKYGDNLVLKDLSLEVERGDRIAIVGQNGQGKTTLAKILLEKIMPTSGTVQPGTQLTVGYYAQNQSDLLDDDLTVLQFMESRATENMRTRVRSILGAFLFSGEDVDKKVKVLSGGEKARLAFAHLLMQPLNLLVLDEPTNHLDMDSKEVLKEALLDYEGTLLVVSHDRDFLSGLTGKTLELRDHHMHTYLGDVNYFLEKRRLDNLREVAMYKSGSNDSGNGREKRTQPASRDEIKTMQRKVKSAEKKVMDLEKELKGLEEKMGEESFYEQAGSQQVTEQYGACRKKLDQAETEWETLVEKLEELE